LVCNVIAVIAWTCKPPHSSKIDYVLQIMPMNIPVLTGTCFGKSSELQRAIDLINSSQDSFELTITSIAVIDSLPAVGRSTKAVDSAKMLAAKARAVGPKPSFVLTRRALLGGYFSDGEYRISSLISTAAVGTGLSDTPFAPLHRINDGG
jgi:hypothetical protein